MSEINFFYKHKKYNFGDIFNIFIKGWEATDKNIKYIQDFVEKISSDISLMTHYIPIKIPDYKNTQERKKEEMKKQLFQNLKKS